MTMTRRRVLAALAAASGAGALTGSTASALLRERERGSLELTTGLVDLVIDYWESSAGTLDPTSPDGTIDGTQLAVPLAGNNSTVFRLSLPQSEGPNNPASLWLKTDCPEGTTLAEAMQVTLSYATADGTPTTQIASGSLRAVANALRTGTRLDGDPTTPETDCLTDELYLSLESDLGPYVGSETVSLPLSLVATQCRNTDPDENPFPAEAIDDPCRLAYSCDCCWSIGKVEVESGLRRGRTYGFDEGVAGYAIRVTDTDRDSGVAFELITTDNDVPRLPLCEVVIKGGPPDVQYPRQNGAFGFDTSGLDGATDGIIYAPENPHNGGRYGISYILVSVCAPTLADGNCPDNAVNGAASVGTPPIRRPKDRKESYEEPVGGGAR